VQNGLDLAQGSNLTLERSTMADVQGTAATVAGSLTLVNVLIGSPGSGIVVGSTGNLTARYVTLADGSGVGIDNAAGGTVNVSHSILWNHPLGDLVNVACGNVSWSLVGSVDCTGVNGNLTGDPGFVGNGDWHLLAGSAALDHGPDPALFTGDVCLDLEGGPRQEDWDGDGFAVRDIGVYEHTNTARTPGDPTGLTWTSKTVLTWTAPLGFAGEYHVHRDALGALSYAHFATCRDDLDAVRTDAELSDAEVPFPGTGFGYLITADDGAEEGTLGMTKCTERSNFTPCP
jgi:hypothetical protein